MARRRVIPVLVAVGCGAERDMPDAIEVTDTMAAARAMENAAARDSMMDTIPGGEMARDDSAAAMRFLEQKR